MAMFLQVLANVDRYLGLLDITMMFLSVFVHI
jgi:hypothetical protein